MKGHKRWRSGAWRLAVFAGIDAETGKQRYVNETVHAPNNRAGAKAADARLAELIAAVENGRTPEPANVKNIESAEISRTTLTHTGQEVGTTTRAMATHG